MKKLKKICVAVLCLTIVATSVATINASSYSQKSLRCPRCKTINQSYGYDPNYKWNSETVLSGEYCPGCNATVPAGEQHTYMYSSDKYYFRCDSSTCKNLSMSDRIYYRFYENPISEHDVLQVNK